jgi:DNA-directed RNA polymerase sigma subunit (sigma70/sigma32)
MRVRRQKVLPSCRVCGEPFYSRSRSITTCLRHRWARNGEVLVDRTTPYEQDTAARLFVLHFAEGAPLEAIGEAMGISRERVRQIVDEAIAKLRRSGLDLSELAARHDPVGG